MSDAHVVPLDDERKHYLADYCWCHPDVIEEVGGTIYDHKALDARGCFEKSGMPTGKSWAVFNMDENQQGALV